MTVLSRLTIRARITGGSLLVAALISVVAGIVIYSQVERIVEDGQMRVLENVEGPYLTALSAAGIEDVDRPGAGQLVAVVDNTGATAVSTLPDGLTSRLATLVAHPGGTTSVTTGGDTYLVRVTSVDTAAGLWTVVSASPDESEEGVLNQVAFLLIASIAVINLAFGAASWFIGTAVLRPVGRLRRSAAALVASPGTGMLPVGPARDEIAELALTLNGLIGELRASADRERQIVSDASHEFRTPLAILQTQLELAQRHGGSLDAMRDDVAGAQVTLARLVSLATSMLELSRIDAAAQAGESSAGELADELGDAADRGRQRVGGRDIRIDFDSTGVDGQRVAVGVADFGRICDNLVNNALAALTDSGSITMTLSFATHGATLRVADDGGGMDEAFVSSAFDRFSRADAARSRGGAGLGLPIVAGIAALAGGSVHLQNRPGSGLTVLVNFPINDGMGEPV